VPEPTTRPDAPFLTHDPATGRELAHRWGFCQRCDAETLLYLHVSTRRWQCGNCTPNHMRAYT
jgi:ribosomal protein S27AE